jgi:hypothetical protein
VVARARRHRHPFGMRDDVLAAGKLVVGYDGAVEEGDLFTSM